MVKIISCWQSVPQLWQNWQWFCPHRHVQCRRARNDEDALPKQPVRPCVWQI